MGRGEMKRKQMVIKQGEDQTVWEKDKIVNIKEEK